MKEKSLKELPAFEIEVKLYRYTFIVVINFQMIEFLGRVPVRLYVWRVSEDFDDFEDAPQIDSWDKISYINRPVEIQGGEGGEAARISHKPSSEICACSKFKFLYFPFHFTVNLWKVFLESRQNRLGCLLIWSV